MLRRKTTFGSCTIDLFGSHIIPMLIQTATSVVVYARTCQDLKNKKQEILKEQFQDFDSETKKEVEIIRKVKRKFAK